ncbi:hypothetical protein AB0M22_44190 [Nocardia sp. NPDC051756]|uniref:hypothetical protein n=1 Tax=Nocardia sp. NPDC051756 TaxID=3154751 RepID=UPI00341992F5
MPRLVCRHADGAVVVAVGGACVVVRPDALDDEGRCATAPSALSMTLVSAAAVESGFVAIDEPMPDALLSAAQIATILEWEVGFVEGVPGDGDRPGLSSGEAELYLRYRPETGDAYPNSFALQAVDRPFSLDRIAPPLSDTRDEFPVEVETEAAAVEFDIEPELLVQLCASMGYVDYLSGDEIVAAAAQDLIDRTSYLATVSEFYAELTQVVATGMVPDLAVDLAGKFDAPQIIDFVERLVAELDRRRPWPDPALVPVDPATWPSIGSSRPIGWLEITIADLEWAVKAPFGDVPDDEQAFLVLRLRSGQLVALVGEDEPNPARFLVLLPDLDDQQHAVEVNAYLSRYAGLQVRSEELGLAMEVSAR